MCCWVKVNSDPPSSRPNTPQQTPIYGSAYRRSAYLDDFEAASASASSNGNGDGGRSGASGAGRRR